MHKTASVFMLSLCSCFLLPGEGETDTDGEPSEIPQAYPTFFIGESQMYETAPGLCLGPDLPIAPGVFLASALVATNDTTLSIPFGDGYNWNNGVLHCDPDHLAECTNIEHRVSDWVDDNASSMFATNVREDDLFADAATLSVFSGYGSNTGEMLYFPKAMATETGSTCRIFLAVDVQLNAGSTGLQGANGVVFAAPCIGSAQNWGGNSISSPLIQNSEMNRVYAFGSRPVILSEDQLAVWWENLVQPGQFGANVAEGWYAWYAYTSGIAISYENLPMVATFRRQGETVDQLIDRASLANIRTGHYLDNNPSPKFMDPIVVDWVNDDLYQGCS